MPTGKRVFCLGALRGPKRSNSAFSNTRGAGGGLILPREVRARAGEAKPLPPPSPFWADGC